ncbi:MAG: hypothetical protein ACYSX1_13275, partial [Planctomycetota bacterium]
VIGVEGYSHSRDDGAYVCNVVAADEKHGWTARYLHAAFAKALYAVGSNVIVGICVVEFRAFVCGGGGESIL